MTKTHIITVGENLWTIARKHYGVASATLVNLIYGANRTVIEEAAIKQGHANSNAGHALVPGTVLEIPER